MVLVYLGIVMVAGPLWMASRKPYKLQNTLVWYNAFQHLASGWWDDYSLSCQPVDYSESDSARRMLHLCWVYYFSKLSEFADTVFFVLRKKKSGHGTFSNIVNNLVHVIMYAYYMGAAMGPKYHKFIASGLILHSSIFI
ncbi:Elongation of very long chain fatty acids protein, partial [Operophtera brumata]